MSVVPDQPDELDVRKARGAFFTPPELCRYIADWAVRRDDDRVLEPSCGEAAFLIAACERLEDLTGDRPNNKVAVDGVELHAASADRARHLVREAGYEANITVNDFFTVNPRAEYDAVVGNPPYVRYQDFSGEARLRSREAALRAGVALTLLASSWAAFTVHAASFLRTGGRLGLVLPAELLTVNYAADVRRFLLERFRHVRLVLFTERVFPGVLEEVVLLLADGFGEGSAKELDLRQAQHIGDIDQAVSSRWMPPTPEAKWSPSLMSSEALAAYESLSTADTFATLHAWGETTLGMVTGNNRYFTLTADEVRELGLKAKELLKISPPGSRHLRGLEITAAAWNDLRKQDKAVYLFRPPKEPSLEALAFIAEGEKAKVHEAYKCKVRKPWWRVPLVPPADLLLTYMNADTPRLSTNVANLYSLNSVHGFYLHDKHQQLGREMLSLASLNSMTFLGAENVGRAYGGGMLKLEPKEADRLPVPSAPLVEAARQDLAALRPQVLRLLRRGELAAAARLVDDVLLVKHAGIRRADVSALRKSHSELHQRRLARGADPRDTSRRSDRIGS